MMGVLGCRSYRDLPSTIGNDTHCLDALDCAVDSEVNGTFHRVEEYADQWASPITVKQVNFEQLSYRDMSLAQTVSIALEHSEVLRDLGATVLRNPANVLTQDVGGLIRTDPQSSVEAALSAYDAQLYALGKWQNNDRQFNNRFFGGGANAFKQDTHDYVVQLSKRTPTGAQFALRSVTDYDANNATGNLFPSAWQTQLHAEVRQPLLQGGGIAFNRIAGTSSSPGVYNGVVIAKVNQEITHFEFQQQVRDYLSNVLNAYWDLYFAYRDLDSKRESLDRSRQTWQSYEAQKTSSRRTGAAEALAREQYFRFQAEYQDAIAGRLVTRTQTNNSTTGGTFNGVGGVLATERRLRLLIGISSSPAELLRPVDEPQSAPMIFDWESMASEAVIHRSELKRQRLEVKRRELEQLAAKNYLMPTLDLVTIYRLRGLDQGLFGPGSATGRMTSFDFQEYEANLELKMPVGFRQAHAAVRHARYQVARARSILREQQRQVLHDLSNAIADADRASLQVETNLNRYLAADDALAILAANHKAGLPVNIDQLLDAQRRISEAKSRYFASLIEYTVAIKNVHLEKGTLFDSIGILIADTQQLGNQRGSERLLVPMDPQEPAEDPPVDDTEHDSSDGGLIDDDL